MAVILGTVLARTALILIPRFHKIAYKNLSVSFPGMDRWQQDQTLHGLCVSVARQMTAFCHMQDVTPQNVAKVCIHDGLENYLAAKNKGKGVLVLTGHIGGWEIGAFAHSVYGYPMNIVVRDIDNPLVDAWARQQRERFGNRTVDGRKYARTYLHILLEGGVLGVLMDTNVTPPRGVFAPFFGVQACTGSAVAKLARHTGAAVVPGFTVWDETVGKYRIIFSPELQLQNSQDEDMDVSANTAQFNRVYEDIIRKYPEQWLWIHRRWKTRPAGEEPFYD